MSYRDVMKELEKMGTAQHRKVYERHGVHGKSFGVSYANLTKLKKRIRTDHDLAEGLWASGNHDARVLATMVADPEKLTSRTLDRWARDLDSYVLTDALAGLTARTKHAPAKMKKWMQSKGEWTGQAGWQMLSHLARTDAITDADCAAYLRVIEAEIHRRKNRVRHSMNGALISIGLRSAALEKRAVAAAKRVGKVEVDHGDTSCKTPDAVAYIRKAKIQLAKRKKK